MTYDSINPNHYRGGRLFEPIEVIEDWGLDYHLGNALKYISRNGRKPNENPIEGLNKAIWYLQRKIEQYEQGLLDQEEIEFRIMGDIPASVTPGSDEFPVTYDDVITFGAWDPSLGPVELDTAPSEYEPIHDS